METRYRVTREADGNVHVKTIVHHVEETSLRPSETFLGKPASAWADGWYLEDGTRVNGIENIVSREV